MIESKVSNNDPPRISATLRTLASEFSDYGDVPASSILLALQKHHPEYGKGQWPNLYEKGTTDRRTFEQWIYSAAEHFNLTKNMLDGRMLVVAIALDDHDLAPYLTENHFLENIESEIKPPLKEILLGPDYDRFRTIISQEQKPEPVQEHILPDNVPTQGDHPAHDDQLGRRAFARALAHRLIRVVSEDNWNTPIQPSYWAPLWYIWHHSKAFLKHLFLKSKLSPKNYSGAFMLHINGPWGSGKSSLLNFIRDELMEQKDDEKWVPVYFNAWRFQRLGPPWWALTRELYRQARTELLQSHVRIDNRRATILMLNELRWRVLHGWGGAILLMGLIVLLAVWIGDIFPRLDIFKSGAAFTKDIGTILASIGATLSSIRFLVTGSARGSDAMLAISGDPMDPLVNRYDQIVKYIGRPVVIFIDDLDRCDGDYVIQLLHGIQTMYWGTQAVYVIAADRNWLRAAYENHYEEFSEYVGEPGRPVGYLFLEKLFQLSTTVPLLSTETMGPYWQSLLGLKTPDIDKEIQNTREQAKSVLENLTDETSILDATRNVDKTNLVLQQAMREEAVVRLASKDIELSTEHALKPYLPLLEPNPRALKRMVNAYGVRRAIDVIRGGLIKREELALWTIIEMRWPILAEHLAKHPEDINIINSNILPKDRDLSEEIKPLLISREVQKVVSGEAKDINHSLTTDGITACVGSTNMKTETLMA